MSHNDAVCDLMAENGNLKIRIEQLEQELGSITMDNKIKQETIRHIQAENERLREEMESLSVLPEAIVQARQNGIISGRMEAAREIVEFLDVCCMSRSAEMIAERFGLEG